MMITITNILFTLIYARYLYFSWKAGFSPLEAIIFLLLIPVVILVMMSELFLVPSIAVLVIAGLFSFSRTAMRRYRHI